MPKEFDHRDEDVESGAIEPSTRDDETPPAGSSYVTISGLVITIADRRVTMEVIVDG